MSERLSPEEIDEAGLRDWRRMYHALQTRFRTGDFATGLRLVNAIGAAAEEANHHPDLDLRYGHLNIRLYSHDVMGITARDLSLAEHISHLAAELDVEAAPAEVEAVELCLDTPDMARVKPFWRAIMGYHDNPEADDEVRDDDADLPRIWFQASGSDEPRQRFHIVVTVPPELARARIEATVAAGGVVVDEQPSYVVLADPDGNRACVCF